MGIGKEKSKSAMGSLAIEPDDINTYGTRSIRNFTTICTAINNINSHGIYSQTMPLNYTVPLLLAQLALASAIILLLTKLLQPFGQPSTISHILGGMILGPSVLGRIKRFSKLLFPLRAFLILDTLSIFGYMFYFFLIGVRIDPLTLLKKIEKRSCVLGISITGFAFVLSSICAFILLHFTSLEQRIRKSILPVSFAESALSFPIIAQYLTELKIINSDFGQIAISASLVSNLASFVLVTSSVLAREHGSHRYAVVSTLVVGLALTLIIIFVLRPAILWMIRKNPEGEPMKEDSIYTVFILVLVTGFCSQGVGLSLYFGPLVLGMVIPAGPPLGSALVDKVELLTTWLFMPLYFVKNGLVINIFGVKQKNYVIVQSLILVTCAGKFLGALLPSLYFRMPMKDALALGLVMNVQGVLELGMFKMMKRKNSIDTEAFVVMCTSMLVVTMAVTPIVRYLYDPSRKYRVYRRRTVMHLRPHSELQVLVCIHDQENVPATINLIEALYPTVHNPMAIYVLHLTELIGRADPLLIPHKLNKKPSSKASPSERIFNAFRYYEQSNHGFVSVHPFEAISSYATMHDNVCSIALDRRVSLVIVPYHKKFAKGATMETSSNGIKIMNYNVLDNAPCSIAILVDRGLIKTPTPILQSWSDSYRVAVLFLGGADDREALALGVRMASHRNINLTLFRLLENCKNIDTKDDTEKRKRMLDHELVTEFRHKMVGNYRIKYIEEVVVDITGTISVIRSLENNYELIIVGRHHDNKSPLTLGLRDWDEDTYLGVIGDFLTSDDFKGNNTVLVVQQHTNVVDESKENQIVQKFPMFQNMGEEETEDTPIQRNVSLSS